eukprot:scaffold377_cov193-Alexandrium_tamarense.AAC.15
MPHRTAVQCRGRWKEELKLVKNTSDGKSHRRKRESGDSPNHQPPGWRVKLYRLNMDGTWDDCGTGRIQFYYARQNHNQRCGGQLGQSGEGSSTGTQDEMGGQHHQQQQQQNVMLPPSVFRELGEPMLCIRTEHNLPQTSGTAGNNTNNMEDTENTATPSNKVLLWTRVLLHDAYRCQGGNIITWCEPFNVGQQQQQQKEKESGGVQHNNSRASASPPLLTGVNLALSFQDNAGCKDIWQHILDVQVRAKKLTHFWRENNTAGGGNATAGIGVKNSGDNDLGKESKTMGVVKQHRDPSTHDKTEQTSSEKRRKTEAMQPDNINTSQPNRPLDVDDTNQSTGEVTSQKSVDASTASNNRNSVKQKKRLCCINDCEKISRGRKAGAMCKAHRTMYCGVPPPALMRSEVAWNKNRPATKKRKKMLGLNNDGPIQGMTIVQSIGEQLSLGGSVSSMNSDSSQSMLDSESVASSLSSAKSSLKVATKILLCSIKGCAKIGKLAINGMCRNHYNIFGSSPPQELKRIDPIIFYSNDATLRAKRIKEKEEHNPATMDATHELYKEYYMTKKTHNWRLSNAVDVEGDVSTNRNFPLEKQKEFARRRRMHIAISKKEFNQKIMARRLRRDTEEQKKAAATAQPLKTHPHPLDGEKGIPANVARQIIQNIKKRGLESLGGNAEDAVVREARRILHGKTEIEDDENKDASDIGIGSVCEGGIPREFRVESFDWIKRGMGEEGKGSIYKHMSIPQIDEFVGWANTSSGVTNVTSTAKDSAAQLEHVPMAPPPPSQVQFLMHRFGERYSDKASEKEHLWSNFDPSALVSMGVAVEEMMTSALMPLAKAHVLRCRRLETEQSTFNLDRSKGSFTAWTLTPSEAVTELENDGHDTATLIQRMKRGEDNEV